MENARQYQKRSVIVVSYRPRNSAVVRVGLGALTETWSVSSVLDSIPSDRGQKKTGISEEILGIFRRLMHVSLPQTLTGNSESPKDWGHWDLCSREAHSKFAL